MKLQPITELNEPFEFGNELAERRRVLNRQIADFDAAVDNYLAKYKVLGEAPELDPATIEAARADKCELLNRERTIRLDMQAFYIAREAERSPMHSKLYAEYERLGKQIRGKLLQIGYSVTHPDIHPEVQERSLREMVAKHPDVVSARLHARECQSNGQGDDGPNQDRLTALERAREGQREQLRRQLGQLV